jgi:outer membrane protein insertion porin family
LIEGTEEAYYTPAGFINNSFFNPVFDPALDPPGSSNPLQFFPITDAQLQNNLVTDPQLQKILAADEPGFLDLYGDEYDDFPFNISWTQSTLNRGRLATRGASQSVGLEITVPGSDTEYYKLSYNGQLFIPLTQSLTLRLRGELGYGDGYGDQEGLPFYQNFFAGGFGSVRGFERNTLGPRSTPAYSYINYPEVTELLQPDDSDCGNPVNSPAGTPCVNNSGLYVGQPIAFGDNKAYYLGTNTALYIDGPYDDADPFGGNVLIEGTAEVLFPLPFIKDDKSIRSTIFLDGGNVFSSECGATQQNCFSPDLGELVYSFGVGVTWITGFGPLSFSLAKPLNEGEYEETEIFQFSLGTGF